VVARALPDEHRALLQERLVFSRTMRGIDCDVALRISGGPELSRLQAAVKEPFTIQWINEYISPGQVLFDIGANVGPYSLYAAMHWQRNIRVYAFEPAFPSYYALCHNIVLNGCQDCIVPLPILLHEETAWVQFAYRSLEAGHALHGCGSTEAMKGDCYREGRPAFCQMMLGMTLDNLCRTYGLPIPHHIKLDVDGAELAVLRGAREILIRPELETVLVECGHDDNAKDQMVRLLQNCGLSRIKVLRHYANGQPEYQLFLRVGVAL